MVEQKIDINAGAKLLLDRFNSSSNEEKQQGKVWYLNAHDFAVRLSVLYGCSIRQASGVIATLSPRNKWNGNKIDAENVILAWKAGKDLNSVKLSSPYPKVEKCIKILEQNIDPDKILVQKSRSFYRCVYYPTSITEVCVDAHSARCLNFHERWIPKPLYPKLQEAHRIAAKELGILPNVLQATTWINQRGFHD